MSRDCKATGDEPMEIGYFGGGMLAIDGRLQSPPPSSPTSRKSTFNMAHPVLQGWACVYGKFHSHKGRAEVFAPGCFGNSLMKNKVQFQLDHNRDVLDDTSGGLQLLSDEKGLAFRLELKNNGVREIVSQHRWNAVSVGYNHIDYRDFNIKGQEVRLIKKADLREISLVRRGAVRQTFARVVDAANSGPLETEMKSSSFDVDSAWFRFTRVAEDKMT
ncbi:HK97 family phage prohead protease [Maritalea sp. S77]|uniref:HK97 family phage prohead protease n=1 Tax=Maritalea sp. S77 TaxID=3415125 RepID=UPI003C7C7BBE